MACFGLGLKVVFPNSSFLDVLLSIFFGFYGIGLPANPNPFSSRLGNHHGGVESEEAVEKNLQGKHFSQSVSVVSAQLNTVLLHYCIGLLPYNTNRLELN